MGGIPSRVLAVLFLGILIALKIRIVIDFVNPTGRYTGGSTIVDVIGHQEVGVESCTDHTIRPIILEGVNYASGAGGGILNDTGKIFVNWRSVRVALK